MLKPFACAVPLAFAGLVQAQTAHGPVDPSCLRSKVFTVVDSGSPQRKLTLAVSAVTAGAPSDIRVAQSSGMADVDKRAMALLKRCRFDATEAGTAPIQVGLDFDAEAIGPAAIEGLYAKLRAQIETQREFLIYLIELESEDDARAVLAQLKDGADFEQLARKLSRSKTAKYGGNQGWGRASHYPATMQQVLKHGTWPALHPEPLAMDRNWYVLWVPEERSARAPDLEDARATLRAMLLAEELPARWRP